MNVALIAGAALLTTPPQTDCGRLIAVRPDGSPGVMFALKGTTVVADVDGFGAAVTVTQTFRNPSRTPVEAIYTFPLPQDAAVDQMRFQVGTRVIEGEIARREEARRTYEAAKANGMSAALLDQERPNIFTQSVANLMPGEEVKVQIRYVQIVPFSEGQYEFSFPMTVGPRFTGSNTPDPDKVSPPTLAPGMRSGATIDLQVNLDAGAQIRSMHSVLHRIETKEINGQRAVVRLARADAIPNRDFILRYGVAAGSVSSGVVSNYVPGEGGTFAVLLSPPKAVAPAQIAPKEMIFVMDQSGSQSGFPLEKSKELSLKLIEHLGPRDTFNVLGFSNQVNPLWNVPRPKTEANLQEARSFISRLEADGGTEMEKAVTAALASPADPERLRIVVFNTDGFAGQENVILDQVRKHRGTSRLFPFGIGNGVNRYLIDAMAAEGRGDVEVVTLAEAADGAVDRLYRRANSPVLTDLSVTAEGLRDMTPSQLPDVFLERPVIIIGRYDRPGPAQITLRGKRGDGSAWQQTLKVNLSGEAEAPSLPSLWARRRVDDLLREGHYAPAPLEGEQTAQDRVTSLALKYRIMSPYTSFVAVEKRVVNIGGRQRSVRVPVEMTEGVTLGLREEDGRTRSLSSASARGIGGPATGGFGGGAGPASSSAAVTGSLPKTAPQPVTSPATRAGTTSTFRDRAQASATETADAKYKRLVDEQLRTAKGEVEVQVLLTKFDDATLAALTKAGLKIEDKDGSLKVVFGRAKVADLKALSAVAAVARIRPL